ncbi:hypothetical protein Pla52o_11400 [Novipirellula galeiformis]|uniref:DUF2513 domain-containing protein n=2 Tax=Novipirellula galeiformis TaxID=2528004 RepID=A0A5C6CPZ8_9BACT|nr:hypothetical protein Pla52o_11400 [Novipirellula galeiformis]
MIRDMDLIRAIVLAIRNHEARPSAAEVQHLIGNVDDGVFGYHIELLTQGAMVTGIDTGPRKDRYGKANLALTWAGQEFADNIVNDAVWASARKTLDDAELKSASFEVWSQIVVAKITKLCAAVSSR